jgi:hypothetical protein
MLTHPGSGAPHPLAHKLSYVGASLLLGQFAQILSRRIFPAVKIIAR